MFFARSHLGTLGAVPAGRGGISPTTDPTKSISTNFQLTGVDGACTSDGKLIYVNGTWRVRTRLDVCAAVFPAEITAEYVRDVMHEPLQLGPFQVPWAAEGGTIDSTHYITEYVFPDPTKAPYELSKLSRNLKKDWGDPHFSITGFTAKDFMAKPADIAKGWQVNGCDGTVKSYQAWMHVLGVDESAYYFNMLPTPEDSATAKTLYGLDVGDITNKFGYPIVPATTFTHPIDGTKWGVFTFLASGTGPGDKSMWTSNWCPYSPQNGALGSDVGALELRYWVAPVDAVKNYLVSTLQDSSTIALIISALESLWDTVEEIANWLGGLAAQLACNVAGSPMCKTAKDSATIAACLTSAAVCAASSGSKPPVTPTPTTPQWIWYLAVPAILIVGLLVFSKPNKPSPQPAA